MIIFVVFINCFYNNCTGDGGSVRLFHARGQGFALSLCTGAGDSLIQKHSWSLAQEQVVYAVVPRPPFSKLVLSKIRIMTDGRSVDVISGNFS